MGSGTKHWITSRIPLARYHEYMAKDSGISQGDTFGHLKVIDPEARIVHPSGSRRAALCRCDCGQFKLVSWNHLTYGRVTSCGCRAANVARIMVEPGFRAGSFTVLGDAPHDRHGTRRLLLRCDCGTETTRSLYAVEAARLGHCGSAVHRQAPAEPPPAPRKRRKGVVHPDDRWGARTVVETGLRLHRNRAVRVRCDCGRERVVSLYSLMHSQSCGCLRSGRRSHGLCHHELFQVHKAMMARCYRPGSKDYRNYGARGIRVYRPWHDVRQFIADIEAEIGPRPEGRYDSGWALYTLDRINNDGDYCPGNMRWATRLQQVHNRRPRQP